MHDNDKVFVPAAEVRGDCSVNKAGCSHSCVMTDNGPICSCPPGHILANNNKKCTGT